MYDRFVAKGMHVSETDMLVQKLRLKNFGFHMDDSQAYL